MTRKYVKLESRDPYNKPPTKCNNICAVKGRIYCCNIFVEIPLALHFLRNTWIYYIRVIAQKINFYIALLADGGGAAMRSMGLYTFICGIEYTSRYVTSGRK